MQLVQTILVVAAMLVAGAAAARYSQQGSLRRNANSQPVFDEWTARTMPTPKPFPSAYNVAPKRCPTGALRVGCIYDTQTVQRRWYHEHVPKEDRLPMTPDLCFDFCQNASGAQFFGLRGGDKCYCTPFFHNTGKGGRGDCDMPCVGDQTRICGGEQMVEVYDMHDCKNLPDYPCKRPPHAPENARVFNSSYYRHTTTPCSNARGQSLTTGENSHCEIECEDGYELVENDLICAERGNPLVYAWGQMQGSATCRPVNCGEAPEVNGATWRKGDVFFPEEVIYGCLPGWTTDGESTGAKKIEEECKSSGKIDKPEDCKRVVCGECPTDGPFEHAAPIETGERVFEDYCNYVCDYGYSLDQQAAGSKTFQSQCVASGTFQQGPGCLPVSCGFPLTSEHAVLVNESQAGIPQTYKEVVKYDCKTGYTLTGVPGESTRYERECQADGTFTGRSNSCKPVQCGKPPSVGHATYVNANLVFNQTVTYTCALGFTMTGKAGGATSATLTCGADGKLGTAPKCVPVECGPAPSLPLARLKGDPLVVWNYSSEALTYQCHSGYSTVPSDNPWKPESDKFWIECQASGLFSKPPDCVNIENCLWQSCGEHHGTCEETEPASGAPLDDYSCKCKAGYEETLTNSLVQPGQQDKVCTNIDDCPVEEPCGGLNAHGAPRGICKDEVLGYSCQCVDGYKVTEVPPKNETCSPVICGQPAPVNNASHSSSVAVVDYDTPPLNYTCNKGFSLNGTASGKKDFQVSCNPGGNFSQPPPCIPVSCGTPPAVEHSTVSPAVEELRYPVQIVYTCEDSHSLDGQPSGFTNFTVKCLANGQQHAIIREGQDTSVTPCKPMECSKGRLAQPHASERTTQSNYVFKQVANIGCAPGYSLDGSTHEAAKSFNVTCERNGEWGRISQCVPVQCGVAKAVAHTTRNDSIKVFPETVEYQLEKGFTLDGMTDGATTFAVQCLENGTFSPTHPVLPVSCGPAPSLGNATGPEATLVYEDVATYSCLHGYTLSGEASGAKSFNVTCTAAGTYVGSLGCKPVDCGAVTAPVHSVQVPDASGGLLTSLVYGQLASFMCEKGYSHDALIHSTLLNGTVSCLPNGSLHYPSPCKNNNDCGGPGDHCAPHGQCVDNAVPTGDHHSDFHCDCDSGFQENATDPTIRTCYNVDDCPGIVTPNEQDYSRLLQRGRSAKRGQRPGPKLACGPGSCRDLVNSYECLCPPGYNAGPNPFLGLAEDCMPVSCGIPSVVPHAFTPVLREVFYAELPVPYYCDSGYSLDETASGETSFSRACQTNGTFQQPPTCLPVGCGQAPDVSNAQYPRGQSFVFPQVVTYTCNPGHSTDATFTPGNTEVNVSCTANGTYSTPPQCKPIQCPPIPPQASTSTNHTGAVLVFDKAVTATCLAGHALDPAQHDATSYTISCDEEGSLRYSLSPHECVPISCGPLPEVEKANITGSPLFGGSVSVKCDPGYSLDRSTDSARLSYEISCQSNGAYPTTAPCLPVSCGVAHKVPNATRSSQEEQFFQGQVTYTLQDGFTTTGAADGAKSFTVACQANGTFTPAKVPLPVSCGLPPDKANSNHTAAAKVFPQVVKYTCIGGHTVNGGASGGKGFELTCAADGGFHKPGGSSEGGQSELGCQPVKCSSVPTPANTLRISIDSSGTEPQLVFPQKAYFKCKLGFSKTGHMHAPPPLYFHTKCLATGEMSEHPGCTNIDDCEGNLCAPNGRCVDHLTPTGVHVDDYHCDCNSGYEPNTTKDGNHSCGNIPDCPANACVPGSCTDLVNDYKCTCPAGYLEGSNNNEGLAHDCLPVPCGKPPVAANATTPAKDQDVVFDDEPVEYECKPGYTLDGTSGGETSYSIACQEDGSFDEAPKCLAVTCGKPPVVENAVVTNATLFFPDKVPYTCKSGYYVTGSATTVTSFQASCEADGQVSGVQSCAPVPCPLPVGPDPFGPNAAFDEGLAASLVFPQTIVVTCLPGYALQKDDLRDITYAVVCKSDGTHQIQAVHCTPIDCGALPAVEHATVSGSSRFGGTATAKAHAGFSIDGSADLSMQSFNMTCSSAGSFTGEQTFQRVICGIAPLVAHTSRAEAPVHDTEKVFEDTIKYSLLEGYTLDGRATGPKEFDINCQADGTFTPTVEPKPVLCGIPPSRQKATTAPANLTFDQIAIYTCAVGHTTNGKASGPQTYSLRCVADGSFVGSDSCMPVECGSVTTPANALQIADSTGQKLGHLEFGQHARFQCKPGFSKDGVLNSEQLTFNVSCRPDGQLHYPSNCTNNDDCASPENQCSPNGKCVDNPVPTGTHASDFRCNCSSGFVQASKSANSSVQVCSNEDNCPPTACLNGTCLDGINDYTCTCSTGFYLGEKNGQADCLPVPCGKPPTVLHAELTDLAAGEQDVDFAMDPVEYSCVSGYTLDGSPHGNRLFTLACQADKVFEAPPECLPVQCGLAPLIAHAKAFAGPIEVVFPKSVNLSFSESLHYMCESGYSLDSKAGSNTSFNVSCEAGGHLSGASQCRPIACSVPPGADPFGPHATYDAQAAAALVFPQALELKCMPGYALQEDDHASTSYNITCQANGKHSTPTRTCTPINCGPAPVIPDGTVSGSTHFGGVLTATANTGYSLGGVVGAEFTSFTFRCLASGNFSAVQKFQPISCGRAPHVSNTDKVELLEEVTPIGGRFEVIGGGGSFLLQAEEAPLRRGRGLAVRRVPSQQLLVHEQWHAVQFGTPSEAQPVAVYNEKVRFTCSVGHFANMRPDGKGNTGDPNQMVVTCKADGTYKISLPPGLHNLSCVPVICSIVEREGVEPVESVTFRRFSEDQLFSCAEDFSLDGHPEGQAEFTEVCEANGKFSADHQCKKIDWCLTSKCEHGECINGNLSYSCKCDKGYEAQLVGDKETCAQIDECVTLSGHGLCGAEVHGSCVDGTLNYTCQCNTGYESEVDNGRDSCQAVLCPSLPALPHTTSNPSAGTKMSYPQTADYYCLPGYTLDGHASGEQHFEVACLADKSYSPAQSCQPVDCGATEDAPNAVKNVSSLKYGEVAGYSCKEGYIIGGTHKNFTVQCLSSGSLTALEECVAVDCGRPTGLDHVLGLAQISFGQTLEATCELGYTVDGTASGEKAFTISCAANGSHTGTRNCVPVSCGVPPFTDFTSVPSHEYFYKDWFEAICDYGYRVDHDPESPKTYRVECAANGSFPGLQSCKPVTCGVPNSTHNAIVPGSEVFFDQEGEWTCKVGFSVGGRKDGKTTYTRYCSDDGTLDSPRPGPCQDINYCKDYPCGNGVCTDLGIGTPPPGYSCSCHEGYEVEQKPTGETCSEDDCFGKPCGDGGSCTDLSKETGVDGTYSCYCNVGYEEVYVTQNQTTCKRKECPALPSALANVVSDGSGPRVSVTTWDGRSFDLSVVPHILQADDLATYTCKDGYSTDGGRESEKTVNVRCEKSGEFSRTPSDSDCQRVVCEGLDTVMGSINAELKNPQERYRSSDILEFQCDLGHTLDGRVSGSNTFEVTCSNAGTFQKPNPTPVCQPVQCVPDVYSAATPSTMSSVTYGTVVTHTCITGYETGPKTSHFSGTCKEDGIIQHEPGTPTRCSPMVCGSAPPQSNAQLCIPEGSEEQFQHAQLSVPGGMLLAKRNSDCGDGYVAYDFALMATFTSPAIKVVCAQGTTVGGVEGGGTEYELKCNADKTFDGAGSASCQQSMLNVGGEVTDSTSASIKIPGVELTFTDANGQVVATATTEINGRFAVLLPEGGAITMQGTKDGYITGTKTFHVDSPISVGGVADLSLSQVLADGEWRVILIWGAHSRDLDSHTSFGQNYRRKVSFRRKRGSDGQSGISVVLDRDDTNGFGPETTTLKGIGSCQPGKFCLIKFEVDNWTPHDGDIGASNAVIQVQRGTSTEKEYTIPPSAGSARIVTIFTLDATEGRVGLHDGEWAPPRPVPALSGEVQETDWSEKFYKSGWAYSKNQLLVGLRASNVYRLTHAKYLDVTGVTEDLVCDLEIRSSGSGWGECSPGRFLNGFYLQSASGNPANINYLNCCKPLASLDQWGPCHDIDAFTHVSFECGPQNGVKTALTGLHRVNSAPQNRKLKKWDRARCCVLATS